MSMGDLTPGGMDDVQRLLASMSGLYNLVELDISGEAGDVVIGTKYPGMMCVGFHNIGTADPATIKIKCNLAGVAGSEVTLKLGQYQWFPKIANIHTIVKSGTDDNLILCLQKTSN